MPVEVRAQRRLAQLKEGRELSPIELENLKKQLEIEILERDARDQNREVAPAVASKDAILIDNSTASLTEVVENMYSHLSQAGLLQKLD